MSFAHGTSFPCPSNPGHTSSPWIRRNGWLWQRSVGTQRARTELIPEVSRLVDTGDDVGALKLAQEARRYAPDDPLLKSLTPLFAARFAVTTEPDGVDVFVRPYASGEQDWQHAGRTPLPDVELPRTALRWRFEKEGFATAERASLPGTQRLEGGMLKPVLVTELHIELKAAGELPGDMVYVPAGPAVPAGEPFSLATIVPSFYIQRTEVTNAEFKEFVDAGGYDRRSFWQELDDAVAGKPGGFEAAIRSFVDSTGRPGPATWELGSHHEGQGDHPVTGVSWYEAAAYARFRGRQLPTYYHWLRAALPPDELVAPLGAAIAPRSNLGTQQPAPVARYTGSGVYGTHDLFGNAREWLWNAGEAGGWLLGGSWNDPPYQFAIPDAAPLFDRSSVNGFRTMRVTGEARQLAALWAPVDIALNKAGAAKLVPVPDAIYAEYRRQLAYEPGMLNASEPEVLDTTDDWVKERVFIDTGYKNERMAIVLFRPRRATQPFQPVVLMSGAQTISFPDRSENIEVGFGGFSVDFVVKSGRMLVQPALQGTFERWKVPYDPRDTARDLQNWLERRIDLGRTLDYLATRTDVAADRIGYLGISYGSSATLPLLAVESRFKAAVLVSGGIPPPKGSYTSRIPLMDVPSHASRIRVPVLMLNGRYDNTFPLKTAAEPLFELLGTPAADKRLVVLEYGHGSPPRAELLRETVGWFDKYLGEVRR